MSVFAVRDLDGNLKLVKTRTVWDAEKGGAKHIQEFIKGMGPWSLLALEPENEIEGLKTAVMDKCLTESECESALQYLFGPSGIVRVLPPLEPQKLVLQDREILITCHDPDEDEDQDYLFIVKRKDRDVLLSEPVWLTHERYLKFVMFALVYALTLDIPQADEIVRDTLLRFNLPPLSTEVTDVAEFMKHLFYVGFERVMKETKAHLPGPDERHQRNSGLSPTKWQQVLSLSAWSDEGDPQITVCTRCYRILASDMRECPGTLSSFCEAHTTVVSVPVLRIALVMLGLSWARSESQIGVAVALGDWAKETLRYQEADTLGPLITKEFSWEMKAGPRQVAWALSACTGRRFTQEEARRIVSKIIPILERGEFT